MDKTKYQAYSPDGITIHPTDTYESREEAEQAILEWSERYKIQGYYRDNQWNKIPVQLIPSRCAIKPI